MTGETCVLINRTSQILEVTQNGAVMKLKPGKNIATTDWIRFAKSQHRRKGTAGPSGLDCDHLIAVEGFDLPENCTMLPPGSEHQGVEIFNRKHPDFDPVGATATVEDTGIQPPQRRVSSESGLPSDVVLSHAQH